MLVQAYNVTVIFAYPCIDVVIAIVILLRDRTKDTVQVLIAIEAAYEIPISTVAINVTVSTCTTRASNIYCFNKTLRFNYDTFL